jgi:hypothetical protein
MAATEKISITLGREELRGAKRLASELGLSLSTFVNDAVKHRLAARSRQRAGFEVIATFAPDERATPQEMEALLALWNEQPRGRGPSSRSWRSGEGSARKTGSRGKRKR